MLDIPGHQPRRCPNDVAMPVKYQGDVQPASFLCRATSSRVLVSMTFLLHRLPLDGRIFARTRLSVRTRHRKLARRACGQGGVREVEFGVWNIPSLATINDSSPCTAAPWCCAVYPLVVPLCKSSSSGSRIVI